MKSTQSQVYEWMNSSDSYELDDCDGKNGPVCESVNIPMAFMQMTHYEATSDEKSMTLIKEWGDFQQFTEIVRRNSSEVKKSLQVVATKVGKPFIPTFELIFSEIRRYDEDECPVLKSTKQITGGYTIIIQGQKNKVWEKAETTMKMNNLNNPKDSLYQYTFNAKMAKCATKPQNYYALIQDELDKNITAIDYNNIWSRDNFVDCDEVVDESTHDYSAYDNEAYPILGNHFTMKYENGFDGYIGNITNRLKKHLPYSYWDKDGAFGKDASRKDIQDAERQLRQESCYDNSGIKWANQQVYIV